MKKLILIFLISFLLLHNVNGNTYCAVSLKQIKNSFQWYNKLFKDTKKAKSLYSMNSVFAIVIDEKLNDIILVGEVNKNLPPLRLDDFVVSLRSIYNNKNWPLVSIDKIENSNQQKIRFDG